MTSLIPQPIGTSKAPPSCKPVLPEQALGETSSHVYPQPNGQSSNGDIDEVKINELFKEVIKHDDDWDPEELVQSDDPEHVGCTRTCERDVLMGSLRT